MCELAQRGMFNVEYTKTSIDQKLNHAWNFPSIKVIGFQVFKKAIQLSN